MAMQIPKELRTLLEEYGVDYRLESRRHTTIVVLPEERPIFSVSKGGSKLGSGRTGMNQRADLRRAIERILDERRVKGSSG